MSDPVGKIREALVEYGESFDVTLTADLRYGDLTTNVAMATHSGEGSVRDYAQEIVEKCEASHELGKIFAKIEVAGPGFINFWYKGEYLVEWVSEVLASEDIVGVRQVENVRLELIENTQPNTNKPLHIGHLRNTALGESIVRLRRSVGQDAISVNLNNDRGIHIVKAMWGYLQYGIAGRGEEVKNPESWRELLAKWVGNRNEWKHPHDKSDHFVGRFYVLGDRAEREFGDVVIGQFGDMLRAWEEGDSDVRALWEQMNEWFYEGFYETHGRFLGVGAEGEQFAKEWYESEIYEEGKRIVEENMENGVFEVRDDEAVIARLEKYNLPDKVVVRSDGTSVYITQDLALARDRIEEGYDFTAYVVGSEQELHFRQLFAICDALGIGTSSSFKHVSYGMVNLSGGAKMSSREGTVVTADSLMDEVKARIAKEFETEDDKVLERVMIGAIKYWMLRNSTGQEIHFDVEESVSLSGNSGPYVMYAYARVRSVAKKSGKKAKVEELGESEARLVREMMRFSYIVNQAAEAFSPNLVAENIYSIASSYNAYYQNNKIVGDDAEASRLAVSNAVGRVLKQGLWLLGIETIERM